MSAKEVGLYTADTYYEWEVLFVNSISRTKNSCQSQSVFDYKHSFSVLQNWINKYTFNKYTFNYCKANVTVKGDYVNYWSEQSKTLLIFDVPTDVW